ncbi:hypothetical protein SAMN04488518_11755 [Pseudovibrio ascidiaceicola]|uniref:DUF3592 domain-containing protein n=1 Tax=Pseudovibrio ascidiaceicola TaxID=285279 RepID=A0A1I4F685_9HYPH|nr:hypothetical protein SAMN04488518_11755 [Pseudovibrio ascidiaceicola]
MADKLVKALLIVLFLSAIASSGSLTHWSVMLGFTTSWHKTLINENVRSDTLVPLDATGNRRYFYSYKSGEKVYLFSSGIHRFLESKMSKNRQIRVFCRSQICSNEPKRVYINVGISAFLLLLLIFALTRQIYEPD